MDTKISISLLYNAIDELDCFAMEADAASEFIEDECIVSYEESRSFKQAVKHLFNAGELLLKYRLQEENWKFIFERVDVATREKLEKGDFKSVRCEDAVKRLENIANIKVKFDEFSKLNKLRNRIEHFEFNIERIELLDIIIASAEETFFFCLELSISSVEHEKFYMVLERAKLVKEKLVRCRNELKKEKY